MEELKHNRILPLRVIFPIVSAGLTLFLCEWIARGTLDAEFWNSYFEPHRNSYLLAFFLLLAVWLLVDGLSKWAPLAVLVTGLLGCGPATVNFYTLKLRGEPFLPWDLAQISEAGGVAAAAGIVIQPTMLISAALLLLLAVASFFVYRGRKNAGWKRRLIHTALAGAMIYGLVFGIYLRPAATKRLGIQPDAWMQDRYYRWYGVISGFMTNLQNLEIDTPDGYSEKAVRELLEETAQNRAQSALFSGSYADMTLSAEQEQTPTILYVMDESYWDVSELEDYGIVFDTDVSANFHRLRENAASGRIYSPSFGGGTCDVEFEALTGFSKEYLPSGSKPYQQHVTHTMASLPNLLLGRGYQTLAVHCYYAKYWSRNTAYPLLGFQDFISLEDMHDVDKARSYYWKSGLVTDAAMAQQMIIHYEQLKEASSAPVFLHAVTMQNHTNYNAENYPDEERVHVLEAPAGISSQTLGALEDFATGVKAADEMLGTLTDYFSAVSEPVILVFFGDHYNPIDSNYDVFTATGYAGGDSADPALHETNLLIWSNYDSACVELGTVAAYEITPVVMELYGIEKNGYFEYLTQQLSVFRSRSCGVTVNPDGTTQSTLSEEQQLWYDNQWLLQYDLMFGDAYAMQDEK